MPELKFCMLLLLLSLVLSTGVGGEGTRKPASERLKACRYWIKEVSLNS